MSSATTAPHRYALPALLATSSLTVMAGAIIAPALPGIAHHFAGMPGAEHLALLVLVLPALVIVLVSPLIGRMVDRQGARPVLLGALLVFALGGSSGLVADTLLSLLLGRVLLGAAVAGLMIAGTALVGQSYAERQRPRVLGLQATASAAAGVLFLLAGGWLAEHHWRYPFAIYLLALSVWPLAARAFPPMPAGITAKVDTSNPLRGVMLLFTLAFVTMMGFYLVPGRMGFLLQEKGFGSAQLAGLAIACATAGSALSSLNFRHLQPRITTIMSTALSFFLLGGGLLMAAAAQQFPLILVAMMLLGLGVGLCQPTLASALLSSVPDEARGRAISRLTAGFFLGQFCSAGLSFLNPSGSTTLLYAGCGAALLLLSLLVATLSGMGWLHQRD